MATLNSTQRAKKFRENMIKRGYKRVQLWVYDLENNNIKDKMYKEAKALQNTRDMQEWDEFILEQLQSIEESI